MISSEFEYISITLEVILELIKTDIDWASASYFAVSSFSRFGIYIILLSDLDFLVQIYNSIFVISIQKYHQAIIQ